MATSIWRLFASFGEVSVWLGGEMVPDPNAPPDEPDAMMLAPEAFRVVNAGPTAWTATAATPRGASANYHRQTVTIPAETTVEGAIPANMRNGITGLMVVPA